MVEIAACLVVALFVAAYAHTKGRTGWHWFILSVCAYGALWLGTVVIVNVAGIPIWLGSPKLALFVGALTAMPILIVLVSVPGRPRRHVASAHREPTR